MKPMKLVPLMAATEEVIKPILDYYYGIWYIYFL